MIQRFSFGHPFPTQSVVLSLPAESGPVPFLTPDGSGWQLTLSEQAAVYGLGEMPRGINKRGWHYITNNTDESRHSEDKLSFYGAHNFLLMRDGSTCFGLFVDFPGKVYYDIGYTRHDTLRFATAEPNYALYLITAPAAAEVAKKFRQLIGPSYIPPKWAFGLAQSRFGYKTEADIREVAAQYKANGLPLDMICMDIDYMQSYADFTIDKARFPDLGKLAADLKAEFRFREPNFKITLNEMPEVDQVLDARTQFGLVYSLVGVPNGVIAMSFAMPGLVETSTNLASVKFAEGNRIVVTSSQRSSVESAKTYVMQMVESVFALAGADVAHSDGYPGWAPNPQSVLLEKTVGAYERLFGTEPKVRAIHAGLECGLFLEKYPELEMVSFGPTLRGVHSPDERLEIPTVDKFWKLLVGVVDALR